MEVEKDLTHLKNILMKKKEVKIMANKENQLFKLDDRHRVAKIFEQLNYQRVLHAKNEEFLYDKKLILELDDLITKFKDIRTKIDPEKR